MSPNVERLVKYLSSSKRFVNEVMKKITIKAKRSGKSFKEYINDNENVSHISLVVYDVLPLAFKFAIRYEKFDKGFTNNFALIREKLFNMPKEEIAVKEIVKLSKPVAKKTSVKNVPTKKVIKAKPVAKKNDLPTVTTPAKKSKVVAKKTPVKSPSIKKVPAKKVVKKIK